MSLHFYTSFPVESKISINYYNKIEDSFQNESIDKNIRKSVDGNRYKIYYAMWDNIGSTDPMEYMNLVCRGKEPSKLFTAKNVFGNFFWKNINGSIGNDNTKMSDIFHYMNGDVWSPKGESNKMIEKIRRTSMCVGDVIYDTKEEKLILVLTQGFHTIKNE
jgi:hypothetical protein